MIFSVKKVLVLVGEFGSGPESWAQLRATMSQDAELSRELAETVVVAYDEWEEMIIENQALGIEEAMKHLRARVYEIKERLVNCDLVMIGHGFGGFLIKRFLAKLIEEYEMDNVSFIRQIIFIATPSDVPKVSWLRTSILGDKRTGILNKLFRGLEPEFGKLDKKIREHLVLADDFSGQSRPLLLTGIGGEGDKLVNEHSARGVFNHFHMVPGDHFSVIEPDATRSAGFNLIRDTILAPSPHPSVFEVAELAIEVDVKHYDETKDFEVRHGDVTRTVSTSSKGEVRRTIRFSEKNICKDLFTIRYGVEDESGAIEAIHSGGENKTSDVNRLRYEKRGLEYFFGFYPHEKPRETHAFDITVYRGFEKGRHDAHFHLGKGRIRYDKIVLRLTLSGPSKAAKNYKPSMYFHPEDTHSCDGISEERTPSRLVSPMEAGEKGTWIWEFSDVNGGVLDVDWN